MAEEAEGEEEVATIEIMRMAAVPLRARTADIRLRRTDMDTGTTRQPEAGEAGGRHPGVGEHRSRPREEEHPHTTTEHQAPKDMLVLNTRLVHTAVTTQVAVADVDVEGMVIIDGTDWDCNITNLQRRNVQRQRNTRAA